MLRSLAEGKTIVLFSNGGQQIHGLIPYTELTPGQKIAATFELLESILFSSSLEDLLVAKRVTSGWKQTIERSQKLQTALFLANRHNTGTESGRAQDIASDPGAARIVKLNEDSSELDWLMLEPTESPPALTEVSKVHSRTARGPRLVNPYLTSITTTIDYDGEDSYKFKPSAKRFVTRGGWETMYLSQPPVSKVVLQSTTQTIGFMVANDLDMTDEVYGWGILVERASGLTMADIHEALSKVNSSCEAMANEYPEEACEWRVRGDYYEDDDEEEDGYEDSEGEHIYYFNILAPPPS